MGASIHPSFPIAIHHHLGTVTRTLHAHMHTHQRRPCAAVCCLILTHTSVKGPGVGMGSNALFTVPLIPLFTISRTAWALVLFSQPFDTNSCESWNGTPSSLLLPAACVSFCFLEAKTALSLIPVIKAGLKAENAKKSLSFTLGQLHSIFMSPGGEAAAVWSGQANVCFYGAVLPGRHRGRRECCHWKRDKAMAFSSNGCQHTASNQTWSGIFVILPSNAPAIPFESPLTTITCTLGLTAVAVWVRKFQQYF